jgi:hypothetical protein
LSFNQTLLPVQEEVLALADPARLYLFGEATTGKSTAASLRLIRWLQDGTASSNILVLGPQKASVMPYRQAVQEAGFNPAELATLTMGGIARRMCQLFWPLVQDAFPFASPLHQPTFLTLETALYYLSQIVDPLLDKGYFSSITIDKNRLYSQILDNLNKASLTGISLDEITQRLVNAWVGDESQLRVYQDAHECAQAFRDFCYQHHLLDYSLQMEIFARFLWQQPLCRQYLQNEYTHLVYDNLEEDPPVIHGIMEQWLPDFQSAILIQDTSGGFRIFMGADPQHVDGLKNQCEHQFHFEHAMHQTESIQAICKILQTCQMQQPVNPPIPAKTIQAGYELTIHKFIPQMLDWITETVDELITQQGVQSKEIAILSPFVSDALFFSLSHRLGKKGHGLTMHRPSRSLKDEAAARTMLTLARLAHPQWQMPVSQSALRSAMIQAITCGDVLIADRVSRILYNSRTHELNPFSAIKADMQQQITYQVGERMEALRTWLSEYTSSEVLTLDSFLGKLYGELLSQPGYPFHEDVANATVIAKLMASIKNFRWATQDMDQTDPLSSGKAYIKMVERGILAATSYETTNQSENCILLLPAYTFLTGAYSTRVQFWLNPGNPAWAERLYQPLTHPYVLSPTWPANKPWTQIDEQAYQSETLYRLINGLLLKCSDKVYFCITKMNEQGQELRGPMLNILQQLFRAAASGEAN